MKKTLILHENANSIATMFGLSAKRTTELLMLFDEKQGAIAFAKTMQETTKLFFDMAETDQEALFLIFKAGEMHSIKKSMSKRKSNNKPL